MEEIERHYDKLVKILARVAGAGTSAGERANAARMSAKYLADHPMPLRWFVPGGVVCQIVPAQHMKNLNEAKAVIRHVELRGAMMFTEDTRVKVEDDVALGAGYLYFQRNGYAIFVPVQHVQVRL